ncbi:hypothetical protein CkaCkLH20_09465 [Colletotrichum karsti]|uniref:Uncharacterized protein n=1 Tax=Colletotrichum karsti TaxID=1095194 RepID=A0A9P6LHU8_9PEZI|nr:uncharacterized protein CkaCkLH20_09465 [Colletotrichum karsti]KAF9872955.1 hypothetical protein CkaCkLH20_09465 [Colletotrichum karsti]
MNQVQPHTKRHPKLQEALDAMSRLFRRNPIRQYLDRRLVAKATREYDLSTREAHMQVLDDFFHPAIAMTMRETPWFRTQTLNGTWDQSEGTFQDRLLSHVVSHLHSNHRIESSDTPKSVEDWIGIIKVVVNQRAAQSCAAQLEALDDMAGSGCADSVLQEETVGHWVKCLVHGLVLNGHRLGRDPRSAPPTRTVSV